MDKLAELRARYQAAAESAKAIKAAAQAMSRDLNDDELAKVQALLADADKAKAEIATLEARAQVDAGLAGLDAAPGRKAAPATPGLQPATQTFSDASVTVINGVRERAKDNPTRGYDGPGGFGRFAAEVHAFNGGQGQSEGIKICAAAGDGLSVGITADGGVLVPPAFSTAISDRIGMKSNDLLNKTDQLPALPYGVESMDYPVVAESSRANGSRAGGLQGYWKAELTAMTESKPKLRSAKFAPSELYVLAYISDKLLKNAPQMEQFLTSRVADEIAFKLGDAIINGTGGGQPRGVLAGAADAPRVQISKESGQAAATLNTTNLEKMYARMPAGSMATAEWYVNQDVLPALLALTKSVGTGGVPVYLPGGSIANAPYGAIYGRPVNVLEYCATLGTEGDVIFADFKQYGTITRGGLDSAMSMHLKFDYAQTAFRFIFEADGQPWWNSSLTPFKGTNKISPFVTLATRS